MSNTRIGYNVSRVTQRFDWPQLDVPMGDLPLTYINYNTTWQRRKLGLKEEEIAT